MPFKLDGDVLTDTRGKTYNVFNQQHVNKNTLIKRYKKTLTNQINMFLKTANDNVDRHDVARYLEQQGILNDDSDRITSSDDYKGIVKTALDNKPTLLGGAKKKRNRTSKNAPDTTSGKALTYLDKIIRPRISVQKHDTRINEDDIIKPLKDKGIIKNKAELTKQFIQRMKAVIFRHNADIYGKEFEKYRQGKNEYQMTVNSIVWWETSQQISQHTVNIKF